MEFEPDETGDTLDRIQEEFNNHNERLVLLKEIVSNQSNLHKKTQEMFKDQVELNDTVGATLASLLSRYHDLDFRLAQLEKKVNQIAEAVGE